MTGDETQDGDASVGVGTMRGRAPDAVLRAAFPGDAYAAWLKAYRRLAGAGYGGDVAEAYERQAPDVARLSSTDVAIDLAASVSNMAIRSGSRAASQLPAATVVAAKRLTASGALRRWLRLIEQVTLQAPESMVPILERTDYLLARLDLAGLESWLRIGVRTAVGDAARRLRFFTLEDPEAQRWLQRESGEVGFLDLEGRLKPFLSALWGISPPLREVPAGAPENARRRPGFDDGVVRMPASFPGFVAADSEKLYRAAVAHVGAHHRFTRKKFKLGGLRPAQVALVSLVEDARVDWLAMRELPGLARLYLPFHVAQANGPNTAPSLFARLSRALIDPAYEDDNGWIDKARKAFFADSDALSDQQLSRRIGDLLGNDLGQMRVQFDAKGYIVQPPYRDDNLGLWDFGDDDQQQAVEAEQIVESVRIRTEVGEGGEPQRDDADDLDEAAGRASLVEPEMDGMLAGRYPEYDYVTGRERREWTTVREYTPRRGSTEALLRLRDERADLVNRLSALIRSARVSRTERLRRQPEGEFLDLDACIDAAIARRIGEPPSPRVHGRYERRHRDLSVLLLLDTSQSTAEKVRGSGRSVLDIERQAATLLAHAMSELGDPFAIAAFCSDRREDVRYTRVKDFGLPADLTTYAHLAGLESAFSTRLGAAIRHAGASLARRLSYRRLLLVVTDGEPFDIDVEDRLYLVEDARNAVQGLNRMGIDTFCVGLDSTADSSLGRIFGRRNTLSINSVDRLVDLLPRLYLKITA
ncbi:nitric oxide reductase activation protein NorD [Mesorhizobium humile]|uniref:VWA domain-containing protein n=1 Tax=Mesorhizobium humile TaxID=3072313 RepID=A0ABU4YF66_9HYPH|nr:MULTISPECIES: VWA domain-containing protein [unclassified Mesorhizobium]MDX8457583.1 VWA domain-containing protein [Mesorhizobium sp. VK2D]MDX8485608.1 VWA domain-containing protein [Mesorhizobium sp. VK2B]